MKAKKQPRPIRYGAHFWLGDREGHVLLRRRPTEGLLGGMLELPGLAWQLAPWRCSDAIASAPQTCKWHHAGQVSHGFTHFEARLDIFAAVVERISATGEVWNVEELGGAALPTVMRKCIEVARFTSH